MRKLRLYIAASIDGYIAREDGAVDWLDAIPNPDKLDYGYYDFYDAIDTTIMGGKTYDFVKGFDIPFPYPEKKNYVVSRRTDLEDEDVEFISGDIPEFVRKLKEGSGKDIWLVGGGQLNTLLHDQDLIDEIILTLIPVVLGKGIPLFHGQPKERFFSVKKTEPFPTGLVQLTYTKSQE